MTDQNNSLKRSVSNQLFNASVIGATIDDFSRNAVLFPVQDPSPNINVNPNAEAQNANNHPQYQATPIFNHSPPPNTIGVPTTLVSNEQIVGPPPTGQPNNLYRRSTTKKVAYAQIPGLVSSQHQSYISDQTLPVQPLQNIDQNPSVINYFQTVPKVPENLSTSSGPLISETTSATLPERNTHLFLPTSGSGAQLTPTIPTDLSGQYGHPQNLSNFSATTSFYGNDIPSTQTDTGMTPQIYRPVYHHWFYKHTVSGESTWTPFSMPDSLALEEAFTSTDLSPETVVATDGNRYDVNVLRRERYAVYWEATPSEVRRCSWFSKTNIDSKFTPYEENVAALLEEEYRIAFERNDWNRFVTIPNSETALFQGPDTLVRLPPNPTADNWGGTSTSPAHYGVLKRTMDEFDIDEGEPAEVDHLFFVVHGIGPWCDFKFRSVQEVVDDFRSIALKLMSSHFHSSRACNRVEILPISWHESVHSEETGVDQLLRNITLESIPRLRDFTNNTLLDILFYTTHIYSQAIITSVATDLNRLYNLFQLRNPTFKGGVSLIGHSLGSLILFDILSHEITHNEEEMTPRVVEQILEEEAEDLVPELKSMTKKTLSRRISNMLLEAGAQPAKLIYPHLNFHPSALYALGSPIGMFTTVRGLDKFGPDFALPTCTYFYNVFHPYDPVAYRIEPLINPELTSLKPAIVPHHMGRKRMHLEIRETFQKVGANIKERVVGSVVSAFRRLYPGIVESSVDATEDEVVHSSAPESGRESGTSTPGKEDLNLSFGILNAGNRIDYALQESPLEVINEYIFAVGSHLCYWNSEDTVLFILTKTYGAMGISPSSPSQD